MKILEICPFSAGIDGVFSRVRQEAILLSEKGHEVRIFSSDIVKGSNEKAKEIEKIGKVVIQRFKSNQGFFDRMVSENVTYFNFDDEFRKFDPDIVITHLLHPHSFKALKLCKKYGEKSYIVTHAPFAVERKPLLSLATRVYYLITNLKRKINEFDKIIAISKWEIPYLLKLEVKKEKIEYIPNGIPDEFFRQKKGKEEKKILFLGRISPVKDLETLIKAISFIEDEKVKLEIAGMSEERYMKKLKALVSSLNLNEKVTFSGPIFDLKEKIEKIDSAKIFVLPSLREGMPQSLIEAMARKKIVIGSDNIGIKSIIEDGKNGYLFRTGDEKELALKIDVSLKEDNTIRNSAYKSVKQFNWNILINKINKLIR